MTGRDERHDDEIDERPRTIARKHQLKFNDLLSHAMIFYTTGKAMKSIAASHKRARNHARHSPVASPGAA